MEIKTFYFNPLRVCCYAVWDGTGECVIIDPGFEGDGEFSRLVRFVDENSLKPVSILLTHSHFDHVLGLERASRYWNIEVCGSTLDSRNLEMTPRYCAMMGLTSEPFTGKVRNLADGDKVSFGSTELEVLSTPGHSPGGLCYFNRSDSSIFTGDTLFCGSIGRSDLDGGDLDILMESIGQKLMPLDGDVRVFPGHGPGTTIGYERATNPFIVR